MIQWKLRRLSELEAEAEEHNARNRALWLDYFSAAASDSDNIVFTRSKETES